MATPLIDSVRRRPAMYIASANAYGFRLLIDNLITAHLDSSEAHFDDIGVLTRSDNTVQLEFSGSFPHLKPEELIAQWETSSKPNRIDAMGVAAALSEFLLIQIWHPTASWQQAFRKGTPCGPAESLTDCKESRVVLEFTPDQTLFEGKARADFHLLAGRLRDIAICHPGVRLRVRDFRTDNISHFHYENGLLDYMREVEHALIGQFNDMPLYHLRHSQNGDAAEAVVFARGVGPFILHSFINGERCLDGGTHVTGFKRGWHDVLAGEDEPAESDTAEAEPDEGDGGDEFDGLTVLLSLRLRSVEWASSFFRHRLGGSGPEQLVYDLVKTELPKRRASSHQT